MRFVLFLPVPIDWPKQIANYSLSLSRESCHIVKFCDLIEADTKPANTSKQFNCGFFHMALPSFKRNEQ